MKVYELLYNYLKNYFIESKLLVSVIIVFAILILAWIGNFIAKKIILTFVKRYVEKSKNKYDDIIYQKKVFNRLSQLVPALVIFFSISIAFPYNPKLVQAIKDIVSVYMVLVVSITITSFFNAINDIYDQNLKHKGRSIKSYIQAINILVYSIAIIISLSIILHKDIIALLAGLGAMTAIILLIFKDSILGLVAGTQLTANDLIRVGDWIVVPKFDADGTVEEITLNIVKVRNWDKTITSVPTYALMTNSFINWRGMEESGGRRIKRHINIDMKSVKLVDEKLYEKFKSIELIKDYVIKKKQEIEKHNKEHNINTSNPINGRAMTNIGTFRKYLEAYLKYNENIHKELTFLVRHLQPSEKGLPIEIYVFSRIQEWAKYEEIQADIFDHILAVIPEFELRIFQEPAGHDIIEAINSIRN